MTFKGILDLNIPGGVDAGFGRRIWMAANIVPGESVIDLGGTGEMVRWNLPYVTAFDDLSGFGPGHRLHAPFVRGDVQAIPFPDQSFAVGVLAEVLEHVPDPVQALREAGRVAGRVVLTTPHEARWSQPIAYRVPGHIRFYTAEILATQIRKAGLDGEMSTLEFGGWAFLVGVFSRNGSGRDQSYRHISA